MPWRRLCKTVRLTSLGYDDPSLHDPLNAYAGFSQAATATDSPASGLGGAPSDPTALRAGNARGGRGPGFQEYPPKNFNKRDMRKISPKGATKIPTVVRAGAELSEITRNADSKIREF